MDGLKIRGLWSRDQVGEDWHCRCYMDYNYQNYDYLLLPSPRHLRKIVTGIQDAINEDNAVTSLMSRGLMVLSLAKELP